MEHLDHFTRRAKSAVQRSFEIIQRYGHTMVDVEHLLLALLEQPEGDGSAILKALEVDSDALARQLDEDLQHTARSQVYDGGAHQVHITPRLKRVIDLSSEEAIRLNDQYISPKHLLLAITRERNTSASRVLVEAGVSRRGILKVLHIVDWLPEIRSGKAARYEPPKYRVVGDVRVGTQAGAPSKLILAQGINEVHIALKDVTALIAALAQAAVEVTSAQEDQEPS